MMKKPFYILIDANTLFIPTTYPTLRLVVNPLLAQLLKYHGRPGVHFMLYSRAKELGPAVLCKHGNSAVSPFPLKHFVTHVGKIGLWMDRHALALFSQLQHHLYEDEEAKTGFSCNLTNQAFTEEVLFISDNRNLLQRFDNHQVKPFYITPCGIPQRELNEVIEELAACKKVDIVTDFDDTFLRTNQSLFWTQFFSDPFINQLLALKGRKPSVAAVHAETLRYTNNLYLSLVRSICKDEADASTRVSRSVSMPSLPELRLISLDSAPAHHSRFSYTTASIHSSLSSHPTSPSHSEPLLSEPVNVRVRVLTQRHPVIDVKQQMKENQLSVLVERINALPSFHAKIEESTMIGHLKPRIQKAHFLYNELLLQKEAGTLTCDGIIYLENANIEIYTAQILTEKFASLGVKLVIVPIVDHLEETLDPLNAKGLVKIMQQEHSPKKLRLAASQFFKTHAKPLVVEQNIKQLLSNPSLNSLVKAVDLMTTYEFHRRHHQHGAIAKRKLQTPSMQLSMVP